MMSVVVLEFLDKQLHLPFFQWTLGDGGKNPQGRKRKLYSRKNKEEQTK